MMAGREGSKAALLKHLNTTRASRAAMIVTRRNQKELQEMFQLTFGEPTNSNNNLWLKRKLLEVLEVEVEKYMDAIGGGGRRKLRRKKAGTAVAAAAIAVQSAPTTGAGDSKAGEVEGESPAGSSADIDGSAAGALTGPHVSAACVAAAGAVAHADSDLRAQLQGQQQRRRRRHRLMLQRAPASCTKLLKNKRPAEGEPQLDGWAPEAQAPWWPDTGYEEGGQEKGAAAGQQGPVPWRQRSRRSLPSSAASDSLPQKGSAPRAPPGRRQLAASTQPNLVASAHPLAPQPQQEPLRNPFVSPMSPPAIAAADAAGAAGDWTSQAGQLLARVDVDMLMVVACTGGSSTGVAAAEHAPRSRSSEPTAAVANAAGRGAGGGPQRMAAPLLRHSPFSYLRLLQAPRGPLPAAPGPALEPWQGPFHHSYGGQAGRGSAAAGPTSAEQAHGFREEGFPQLLPVSVPGGPLTQIMPNQQEGVAAATAGAAGRDWPLLGPAPAAEPLGMQPGLLDCLASVAGMLCESGDWAQQGRHAGATAAAAAAATTGAGQQPEQGCRANGNAMPGATQIAPQWHMHVQPPPQQLWQQRSRWQPPSVPRAAAAGALCYGPGPACLQPWLSQQQEHWLDGALADAGMHLASLLPDAQQLPRLEQHQEQQQHQESCQDPLSGMYAGGLAAGEVPLPLPSHPSHSPFVGLGIPLPSEHDKESSLLRILLESALLCLLQSQPQQQ